MAEMLALRGFPAVRGLDSDFNKGRCNGNQFEDSPAWATSTGGWPRPPG